MYSPKPLDKKITLPHLRKLKQQGEKFACLTAYDYSFGFLLEQAGVEVILVGDSLGMVIQGHDTTLPVTVDDIAYHCRAVSRGLKHALLMADMPFGSIDSPAQALANATRLLKESGAQIVKLEGGELQRETVRLLAQHSIPVCAHLGLQPQSVHKMGGYRVQGREPEAAQRMKVLALELQQAGADLLLLECVPRQLAAEITAELEIPVIGIGAGVDCDGQILVLQDMLGITPGRRPGFSMDFNAGSDSIADAVTRYVAAVKNGDFPGPEHGFD
jgi:3-methyl-2-oxobutanoate hydroxymethyltransferase